MIIAQNVNYMILHAHCQYEDGRMPPSHQEMRTRTTGQDRIVWVVWHAGEIWLFLWNTFIPLEYFYSSISELDYFVPVVAWPITTNFAQLPIAWYSLWMLIIWYYMRIVNIKMVGCLHRTEKCERARQVRMESFELYDTLEKYDYFFGILLFLWNTSIPPYLN